MLTVSLASIFQIEEMEVSHGVIVKEGGRVKKGPGRVGHSQISCFIYHTCFSFISLFMVFWLTQLHWVKDEFRVWYPHLSAGLVTLHHIPACVSFFFLDCSPLNCCFKICYPVTLHVTNSSFIHVYLNCLVQYIRIIFF